MSSTENRTSWLGDAAAAWRRRWFVGAICATALLVTFAVTKMMPPIYESTATLLAPRETGPGGLLGALPVSGLVQQTPWFGVPSLTPNRDMLVSILRSRTVAQTVVERFRLQESYKTRYLEDAIKKLQNAATISASREGVVAVKVEDTDPRRAAEIANFYVERLDRLVAQYGVGEAGRHRAFLAEQLARSRTQLDTTERALRQFQEKNRAIVLQEQTRGAIEAAARLKGEIMASEVQLQVMRNFATEANPEVLALRRRIDEMNRQLRQMQYGDGLGQQAPGARPRDFTVPFARVPEIGLELARLMREVKVQETLVALLEQQAEQARIAEAKDIPVVRVLDSAVPAERAVRPRLGLNLAVAGLAALIAGLVLSLLRERGQRRCP
jgi:uncharacterized protein involved in exopolysaccharide biosynthesis